MLNGGGEGEMETGGAAAVCIGRGKEGLDLEKLREGK